MKTKSKLKEKDYVDYDEYIKSKQLLNKRMYDGWEFIYEKSVWKIVIGAALVMVGFITLPLPTGSIPMMILGMSLLTSCGIDLALLRKTLYWRIMMRLNMRRNLG